MTDEPRPDLAVVIVNYNAGDYLVRCQFAFLQWLQCDEHSRVVSRAVE